MVKKLTIEQIRVGFEGRGWKLLDTEKNSKNQFRFECENGHQSWMSWGHMLEGRKCSYCSGRRRINIDTIAEAFNKKGWVVKSQKYENAHAMIPFICNKGHSHQISWNAFQAGRGCAYCAGSISPTIEHIRSAFEIKGWVLLSNTYINTHSILYYICDKNHHHQISWNSFLKGTGCGICTGQRGRGLEVVRELFTAKGWTLLSDDYVRAHDLLNFICDKGHQHQIRFNTFVQGGGCGKCANNVKLDINVVSDAFLRRGLILLDREYSGNKVPLKFKCSNGHFHQMSWDSFTQGTVCGKCQNSGFLPDMPAILYYVEFEYSQKKYYKIGITRRSVHQRLSGNTVPYRIIKQTPMLLGSVAYAEEQKILKKYEQFRYKGKPFLKNGNTEVFVKDVLCLVAKT